MVSIDSSSIADSVATHVAILKPRDAQHEHSEDAADADYDTIAYATRQDLEATACRHGMADLEENGARTTARCWETGASTRPMKGC